MILVTGGAGFIGSNFVLDWLAQSDEPVINLDTLSYAGNVENFLIFRAVNIESAVSKATFAPSPSGRRLG